MPSRLATIDPKTRLLHLVAATGLGVAQPLYDVLGRHPEFAIAHRLEVADLWFLTAVLSFGVGAALWVLTTALGLVSARASQWSHVALVGVLVALGPLGLVPADTAVGRVALLAVSAGLAGALYRRSQVLRRLMSLLAAGAVVFPLAFLWGSFPRGRGRAGDLAAGGPARGAVPVVLVVFDELPLASLLESPHTLDAVRFPNFAAFASTSLWFRNATTVAQSTRAAIPAIVTGKYPSGNVPPTAQGHPETLFTLSSGRYNLNVVETTTRLCGSSCEASVEILGWSERVPPALADLGAVYLALVLPGTGPPVDDDWTDYWAMDPPPRKATRGRRRSRWRPWEPPRRLVRFLRGLEESPRTTLHFLHLALPHAPWRFLPRGRVYAREEGHAHGIGRGGRWDGSEWEVVQGQQRHLLQLQYADELLGQIVGKLRHKELFDESLIVVTADHGASFQRGELRRALTEGNLVDVAHVPLFVKRPGQVRSEVRQGNVETIDIAPTIAGVMGLGFVGPVDGTGLLGGKVRGATKTIFRSWKRVGAGERWTFPMARLEQMAESIRVKNARFPEASLYAIGADRGLIGRRVTDLPQRPSRASMRLEHPAAFDDVDPEGWMLPVHVMGRLRFVEPVDEPQRLAVSLAGVIQAVGETFGELPAEESGFSVLLDPAVLRPGKQQLEVFLVEDGKSLSPAPNR